MSLATAQAAFSQAVSGMIERLRAEMSAGGNPVGMGKPTPIDPIEFDYTLSRVGVWSRYIVNPEWSLHVGLDTDFVVGDVLEFDCYIHDDEIFNISSNELIVIKTTLEIPNEETIHELVGPVQARLLLIKTTTGWDLYL